MVTQTGRVLPSRSMQADGERDSHLKLTLWSLSMLIKRRRDWSVNDQMGFQEGLLTRGSEFMGIYIGPAIVIQKKKKWKEKNVWGKGHSRCKSHATCNTAEYMGSEWAVDPWGLLSHVLLGDLWAPCHGKGAGMHSCGMVGSWQLKLWTMEGSDPEAFLETILQKRLKPRRESNVLGFLEILWSCARSPASVG